MNKIQHNYLPEQYDETAKQEINHNYLPQQFAHYKEILEEIGEVVKNGEFTLGRSVDKFEEEFRKIAGTKYAIGVGSGTDALFLSLKALGIDKGDEVVTVPYTFFATVGAIVTAGAKPVFVDVGADYNMDPEKLEAAITEKTKAILPVHWAGLVCDMEKIMEIADRHNIPVVEDSCHGIQAHRFGKMAGSFGALGCFSMHPLKNLNIWGDGGVIVTDSDDLHKKLVLLRNHGLVDRNICEVFAYNSRLDSIQAVVAVNMLKRIDNITTSRIGNAEKLDEGLKIVGGVTIPARPDNCKQVFHLYVLKAERRDELVQFLISRGVDAKIHYPVPMHLQPAARDYGYTDGDFPVAESTCKSVFSLPVHEFITDKQINTMISAVKEFYGN
jgi:dTDP-3-amino-2,3,6-trideoxy-4-keto-D-glucose/dTDP-3-amino-3,4,6-trideoxy-alpha-D-glucose/dTDP-2,6-dideoxy-D-kanosamine transaminase